MIRLGILVGFKHAETLPHLSGATASGVSAIDAPSLPQQMSSELVAQLVNSAYAANAQRRFDEAVRLCSQALQLASSLPVAWYNLGVAQRGLGDRDAAVKSQKRAAGLSADSAEAQNSIGLEFVELRANQEAEICLKRALQLRRDYAPPYVNLGLLRRRQGRIGEAEALFRKAVEVDPDVPQAHSNLGAALNLLQQPGAALDSCQRAIELDPNLAEAWNNMGVALRYLRRHGEAVEAGQRAVELSPSSADALYNHGVNLMEVGRGSEAVEVFRKALSVNPEFLAARWALVMSLLPRVQQAGISLDENRAAFVEGLAEIDKRLERYYPLEEAAEVIGTLLPFSLAYQERNNRDLLATYGRVCASVMERWQRARKLKAPKLSKSGRIRVGFASSHVRQHSVWDALMKGWFTKLDRSRFAVICFSLDSRSDQETLLAKDHCDIFIDNLHSLSDWASAIVEQAIDVLIYPEIGMDKLTTQLASMRLAPVQVASWGHPETTGLPTLDHYLSAEDLEPEDSAAYYTERLVKLPNLGCSCDAYRVQPTALDLARYDISPDRPLLLSPGTAPKYSLAYDEVLVGLAKAIPDAQLIFFSSNTNPGPSAVVHERIRTAFSGAGLNPAHHVRILPWLDRPAFFWLLRRATVYLDTMGFSGFNTAMQAIECGLPVVSKEGRYLRGRLASGILKRLELPELVAYSDEQYIALVSRIVADDDYRAGIRRQIGERYPALLNDPLPVQALEHFLQGVSGRP